MKRATRRLLERMSNIYKILQETFQGIRVVKAFTMEPYERRRFKRGHERLLSQGHAGREHRRPGRPDHRGAGRRGRGPGPARRRLPGAEPGNAPRSGSWLHDRPAAGGRGAAADFTPAWWPLPIRSASCRASSRASSPAAPPPTASSATWIAAAVHGNSRGRAWNPGAGRRAPTRHVRARHTIHRVPRRLLLLRAGPADPVAASTSSVRAGETVAAGRQERLRQDDAAEPAAALLRPRPRQRS